MTDQLERDLARLFAGRAEQTEVPPYPADLFAGGRVEHPDAPTAPERKGRRALVLGLVAAAAVAAVAVPVGLAWHGDDVPEPAPAPTSPPQTDSAPVIELPYIWHGELHVGDLVVPTGGGVLVTAGDEVLVATVDGDQVTWERLVDDALEPVPVLDGAVEVVASEDGSLVAAVTGDRRSEATVWDLSTGEVVDTIRLADPPEGYDAWLFGFDPDGRLYWQDGAGLRMRTRAGDEVTVRTDGRVFAALAPGGLLLTAGDGSPTVLGTVSDDGSFRETGEVPLSTAAVWGGAGRLAYVDLADGRVYAALPQIGATPVLLDVDADHVTPLGWSGDRVVVLAMSTSGGGEVLLVDPATGESEEVFTIGKDAYAFPPVAGTGAL